MFDIRCGCSDKFAVDPGQDDLIVTDFCRNTLFDPCVACLLLAKEICYLELVSLKFDWIGKWLYTTFMRYS